MPRRTTTACALAVLLILPAALIRADDAPKGDKDLDGDWEMVSAVRGGQPLPQPEAGKPVLTIKGDTATLKLGDKMSKATIKVDASKTPKTIDITAVEGDAAGMTMLGIYEVKGDELRMCRDDPGKDRPKELVSKEGSGATLAAFKRVKE